jgi:hypothetical protein
MGAAVPSFGPLINPSSETASPVRTFPMLVLLSHSLREATDRSSGVVRGPGLEGQDPGSMPEHYAPGS